MNLIGLICPCFKKSSFSRSSSSSNNYHETELISNNNTSTAATTNNNDTSLASFYTISSKMSSPTIKIQGLTLKGHGLALVNVSIDQDCAYWEWHVNIKDDNKIDDRDDFFNSGGVKMKFGVATRKDQVFYRALNEHEDDEMDDGTALMKPISNIQNGDTIGIAIQQDDLPMIQFLLNGEPLHDIAINRFRGMVYPSVFIPSDDEYDSQDDIDGNNKDKEVSVTFVWKEDEFQEMSPSVRFKPLMAAIGII